MKSSDEESPKGAKKKKGDITFAAGAEIQSSPLGADSESSPIVEGKQHYLMNTPVGEAMGANLVNMLD